MMVDQTGGLSITESNVSNPANPTFDIAPADLSLGNTITISYARQAACEAIDYQQAGGIFKDVITVSGDAGNTVDDNLSSASYSLLTPSISLFHEGPISTSVGSTCLLYTSPSPRDQRGSRMPSSA